MEPSPLTQESRPDTFQPKVVRLYESLFREEEEVEKSEGFWEELFLHKPDGASLRSILGSLSADDLLHFQAHPQQFVRRAINRVRAGSPPSDENALETLTVFLGCVLSKRYTNPSSDIISLLAGLDDADAVFSDLVLAIDSIIRNGSTMSLRQKAVCAALSMISGAYSTGLVSYFTHRDLFPSLMKFVQDSEASDQILEPFALLSLLVNYNKFEFQNPYQTRLNDFVNEGVMKKLVFCIGDTCAISRDKYVAIQEDLPEGWSISGTLSMVGLGALAGARRPSTQALSPDDAKVQFSALPGNEATIILSTYDFASANKLFCYNLVTTLPDSRTEATPFSSYISLTSYLLQHAHRSSRSAQYTCLCLYTIQLIVEDQNLVRRICAEESKTTIRLCRQRQPFLPLVRGERVMVVVIMDLMIDGINHNLRRRLDIEFYILCTGILLRIVSFLGKSRIRIAYHWSELWRSLLSFIRFLTAYSKDIKTLPNAAALLNQVVNLNALALSTGEAFLPDAAAYDDLFYKLVEAGDFLLKFRDAYDRELVQPKTGAVDSLIGVSRHYHGLLEEDGRLAKATKGGAGKHLSARQVQTVIQRGYETLSIQAKDGLDRWERFREAEHKNVLKKAARVVVGDVKEMIGMTI